MWSVYKQINKETIKHKCTGEFLQSILEYASTNVSTANPSGHVVQGMGLKHFAC